MTSMKENPKILPSSKSVFAGVFVCLMFVILFGGVFKEQTESLGHLFVSEYGLWGLFLGVLVTDSLPTPGGAIPLMTLCLQGGAHWMAIGGTCLAASCGAGFLGYGLGLYMGIPITFSNWIEDRFPGKISLLKEKGMLGVAAFAALPIPITFGTWLGGAISVKYYAVFLACLVRLPKVILFLWIIMGGLKLVS